MAVSGGAPVTIKTVMTNITIYNNDNYLKVRTYVHTVVRTYDVFMFIFSMLDFVDPKSNTIIFSIRIPCVIYSVIRAT